MKLKKTINTLIANIGVSTVLAFITMYLLLMLMPLRHLFNFASDSMNWGPAQGLPFAFADLLYVTSGKIVSIILGISAGVMMTFMRLNSAKWWIVISGLFVVYCLCIIFVLLYESSGWGRTYWMYYLDILLCPVVLLGELEFVGHIKRLSCNGSGLRPS